MSGLGQAGGNKQGVADRVESHDLDEITEGMRVTGKSNTLGPVPWALLCLEVGTWGDTRKGDEEHIQRDTKEQLGQ